MQQLRRRRLAAAVLVAGGTLLTPQVARAQTGKIAGVVTDAQTGQPIEGVQVAVQGTGYGAITQANGRYFIIAVPPGTYSVVARRIGYQGTQVAGVQVAIDVTRELNFRLNSAATTLVTQQIVAEAAPLVGTRARACGSATSRRSRRTRTSTLRRGAGAWPCAATC
jgi:hypothetical protein